MSEQNHDSLPLSNAERIRKNQERRPYPISPYEVQVINALRGVKYGSITIHVNRGIPLRYTFGASYNIDPDGSVSEAPHES